MNRIEKYLKLKLYEYNEEILFSIDTKENINPANIKDARDNKINLS